MSYGRPKLITHHVFNERMAERGRTEAKRTALVQTLQQGADLKANAEGLMRAQNLQRRNVAAMKSAEQMFGREYEARVEFDRRKARDEAQTVIANADAWEELNHHENMNLSLSGAKPLDKVLELKPGYAQALDKRAKIHG